MRAAETIAGRNGTKKRSAGWLELLVAAYRSENGGAKADVQLRTAAEDVRLRVRGGRLQRLSTGEGDDAALTIGMRELDLRAVLLGEAPVHEAFADAEVLVDDLRSPALPAVEAELPRVGNFDSIPGATLSAAIEVTSTVFGRVGVCERWRDGVLVSSQLLPLSQAEDWRADVRMSCTLSQLASIRRGQVTPLDALADGVGLLGEWPALMCFVELMQHPAYAPVWEADGTLEAQCEWGAVFCSSPYGDAALRAQLNSVRPS